jgi:hypothetical protein
VHECLASLTTIERDDESKIGGANIVVQIFRNRFVLLPIFKLSRQPEIPTPGLNTILFDSRFFKECGSLAGGNAIAENTE